MLKVRIFSFSYIYNGIPADETKNGGGFVFDCRFIHNPGKYDEYKDFNGKDENVKEFLKKQQVMTEFMQNMYKIVDKAVENYKKRDFTDLMVSFGCTGGRHRSVYSAESLFAHLTEKFPDVKIEVSHLNII
ncbi:MAG: RNase adapter RapZ [Ignavibacteria bacterium]|nr:RNase adapter RapZ [Ignavibacteria bacterium]